MKPRQLRARYRSRCPRGCGRWITPGERITMHARRTYCAACWHEHEQH